MSKLRAAAAEMNFPQQSGEASEFYWRNSELFEDGIYLEEVSDVLCIAQAELPNLLQITELADSLLHVPNGDWLICRLVANNTDSLHEVCHCVVLGGGAGGDVNEDDVGTRKRCEVLSALCRMNPGQALCIRAMAVNASRLPALTISLTLEHHLGGAARSAVESCKRLLPNDLLEFVSGLLLNNDPNTRVWFALFVRNEQKKKSGGTAESISSQMVKALRQELRSHLELILDIKSSLGGKITRPSAPISLSDDARLIAANSFIRLYCALKGIASMKFSDEESALLVTLLTSRPSPTPPGVRFISLSLSMIIACPGLFSQSEDERRVAAWLQWLQAEAPRFERDTNYDGGQGAPCTRWGGGFGEMLLLIAIHFHGNQMTAISDLVCATLGMKVPIRSNALVRLKAIFTQEIFSEKVVTSLAVSVPVTSGLSAHIPGYLSVHCIHQLLKSRAFAKHKVPIKGWICRQLRQCRAPLHPVVPHLVDAFVNSTLIPSRQAAQNTNEPLTQQEVLAFFATSPLLKSDAGAKMDVDDDQVQSEEHLRGRPDDVMPQMLVLYYLLLYEDVRMAQMRSITTGTRHFLTYSPELWDELPIKFLLRLAHRDQHNFADNSGLYASLLRLVANHFPHLCLVEDWLTEEEATTTHPLLTTSATSVAIPGLPTWAKTLSPQSLQKAFQDCFDEKTWTTLTVLLTRLAGKDASDVIAYAETLTSNLCCLLPVLKEDGSIRTQPPRKILDLVNTIWLNLSAVMPRHLHVMTVNGLRNSTYRSASSLLPPSNPLLEPLLTQSDIITDPLTVLRCDERVFRSPPLLDITLHILTACLQASKAMLAKHIRVFPSIPVGDNAVTRNAAMGLSNGTPQAEGPSDPERDELRFALVAAQDSAATQILLEWCLPTKEEEGRPLLSPLREIQCLVSSWLHQMFIADPTLAKLLHFQGYPTELLHVTVAGVPSMHICIDFVPELLRQPQLEKQVFAIQLVSYLSLQYPLPRTLSVARLCINVMATLLTVLPRHQRIPFFLVATPSLSRIARAFPPLTDDVTSLLLQLGRICNASTSKCSFMAAGLVSPKSRASVDDLPAVKSCMRSDIQRVFTTLDAAEVGLAETVKDVFGRVINVAALLQKT